MEALENYTGRSFIILDFKLSPCYERRILSSGRFPGDCSLNLNYSRRGVTQKEANVKCYDVHSTLRTVLQKRQIQKDRIGGTYSMIGIDRLLLAT
jgi:hypothetical protein